MGVVVRERWGAVLVELLIEAQDHRPGCLPQLGGVPGLEGMDAGVVGSVAVLAVALWLAGERVELGKQALHSDTRNRGIAQFLQSPDVDPPPAPGMPAVALDSDRVAASVAGFRWAAALPLPPCPYMHAFRETMRCCVILVLCSFCVSMRAGPRMLTLLMLCQAC